MWQAKRVWITGASSGIGEALAKTLAQKKANLVLSARNREALKVLKERLPRSTQHQVVPLDLSQSEQLLTTLPSILQELGNIDVVINNGGVSQRGLFVDTTFSAYRQLMEVNYFGTIAIIKAVLPQMMANRQGTIVAISSVAGKVGSKYRSGYSASKFAVVGFMDCLRAELADSGVHCLTICPGSIKTKIAHNSLNEQGVAQNKPEHSIENGMDVDQCARLIIRAIEKCKDEVVIGKGLSYWAPTIKRFFPSLFNRLTAKVHYR